MTTSATRIPPALHEDSALDRIQSFDSIVKNEETKKQDVFQNVQEYIEDCYENGLLQEPFIDDDGKINISGNLVIDGNKVAKNLDWSNVVADTAKVINNSKSIEKYTKLPLTKFGIMAPDIAVPDAETFAKHNAFGRFYKNNDEIIINGDLRVSQLQNSVDLSKIKVKGNIFWTNQNQFMFENLPSVDDKNNGKYYGINPLHLSINNTNKLAKKAQEKGFGTKNCKEMKKKEPSIFKIFSIGSSKAS